MPNKYYSPGTARSERVRDLFSTIAARYDLLNDLQSLGLHRRWKSRLVEMAQPHHGARALDLCCGTGDVALLLASRGVDVVALDFSDPMLAKAACRVASYASPSIPSQPRLSSVVLCRADGQALPFLEASFDIVTVAYGLRNLANWRLGLAEMWRVTRPGGRILVLDFGKPSNRLWETLYFAYLRWVVPLFGRVFCGDAQAYAYILDSLKQYPAQQGVTPALKALCGEEIREVNLLGGAMSIHLARKRTTDH